jgi:hypothetical protein
VLLFTLWARNAIPRYRCGEISERSGSKHNKISLKNTGIKIVLVAKIEDVVSELFG